MKSPTICPCGKEYERGPYAPYCGEDCLNYVRVKHGLPTMAHAKEMAHAVRFLEKRGWKRGCAFDAVGSILKALHVPCEEGKRVAYNFGFLVPRPTEEPLRESLALLLRHAEHPENGKCFVRKFAGDASAYGAVMLLKEWAQAAPAKEPAMPTPTTPLPWTYTVGEYAVTTEQSGRGYCTSRDLVGRQVRVTTYDLNLALENHYKYVNDLYAMVARCETATKSHASNPKTQALEKKVADLNEEIELLKRGHAQTFDNLSAQLKMAGQRLSEAIGAKKDLERELAAEAACAKELREEVDRLHERGERIGRDLKEQRSKVGGLEAQCRRLEIDARLNNDYISRRIGEADRRTAEVADELRIANDTITTLRSERDAARRDREEWCQVAQQRAQDLAQAATLRRNLLRGVSFLAGFLGTLAVGVTYWHTLGPWIARVWQHAPGSSVWLAVVCGLVGLLVGRRLPVRGRGVYVGDFSEVVVGVSRTLIAQEDPYAFGVDPALPSGDKSLVVTLPGVDPDAYHNVAKQAGEALLPAVRQCVSAAEVANEICRDYGIGWAECGECGSLSRCARSCATQTHPHYRDANGKPIPVCAECRNLQHGEHCCADCVPPF